MTSMLEDWLKAFVAGSAAVLITSNYNAENALKAGIAAVLPMIYAWANTKDTRYGRKPYPGDPTKRPPYRDIMQWIKIKPLKLRNRQGEFIKSTESAIKSAAIAIAKSIGENGIQGINYYQDAINDTWEDYSEQLILTTRLSEECQL